MIVFCTDLDKVLRTTEHMLTHLRAAAVFEAATEAVSYDCRMLAILALDLAVWPVVRCILPWLDLRCQSDISYA